MNFVLLSKTIRETSTEIVPPLFLSPPFKSCALALPRAKKDQPKVHYESRRECFVGLSCDHLQKIITKNHCLRKNGRGL